MKQTSCLRCRFYEASKYHKGAGRCCRYPPIRIADPNYNIDRDDDPFPSVWPVVEEDEWCGELQIGVA